MLRSCVAENALIVPDSPSLLRTAQFVYRLYLRFFNRYMHRSPPSKNRHYAGEPVGSYVANFLNGKWPLRPWYPYRRHRRPTLPERERVARIAVLISMMQKQLQLAVPQKEGPIDKKLLVLFRLLTKDVGRYRYRLSPGLGSRRDGSVGLWASFEPAPSVRSGESVAVRWLFILVEQGCFDHLRHCEQCSKWFFAHIITQRFCPGGKCEKKHREQNPAYKEYHRRKSLESYHFKKRRVHQFP
jgi:hypothetical protein